MKEYVAMLERLLEVGYLFGPVIVAFIVYVIIMLIIENIDKVFYLIGFVFSLVFLGGLVLLFFQVVIYVIFGNI